MSKLILKRRISALAGALLAAAATAPAAAGDVSSEQIVRALSQKPLTRSLAAPRPATAQPSAKEAQFIASLRNRQTRSLSSAERQEISAVIEDKPKIDLEINFEYNSAEISPSAVPAVAALGNALTSADLRGATFLLAGHTDAAGGEEYNQGLSERRADTIKRHLVEKFGINGSELVTVGYGKTNLKNPNTPLDPANRRVQVVKMAPEAAAK